MPDGGLIRKGAAWKFLLPTIKSRLKPAARHETSEYHARATEQYGDGELNMAKSKRCGSPTDYPKPATRWLCSWALGHSLTAAAGAMGVSRDTINRWMDAHEEFRDAVSRGKAARVFALESQMLASDNSAVINARRLALANAAPEEWREKPVVDSTRRPRARSVCLPSRSRATRFAHECRSPRSSSKSLLRSTQSVRNRTSSPTRLIMSCHAFTQFQAKSTRNEDPEGAPLMI